MQIGEMFKEKDCVFSVEVFPPKKTSGIESLAPMLRSLQDKNPDYVSVTYSAGGAGDREKTADIAQHLKNELHIEPMAHLTCYGTSRQSIGAQLERFRQAGVCNILALRGDAAPDGDGGHDFAHASDLMQEIARAGGFAVAGACYPEGHPQSATLREDAAHLLHKQEAGAQALISQLFFDNGKFYRFLNLARKMGVRIPIEAGVMPIVRTEQLERTVKLSSASLPSAFTRIVARYGEDAQAFFDAGIDYAIWQIRDLIQSGVDGIHLYAMNQRKVARLLYEGIADLLV